MLVYSSQVRSNLDCCKDIYNDGPQNREVGYESEHGMDTGLSPVLQYGCKSRH